MGTPATTTATRPLESSTSAIARPDPTAETSSVESVVPPLYMSNADTFSESSPNYSSISADQSYFCSAASADIASSVPTSATPPIDPAAATTSSSTEDAGTSSSEAGGSEVTSSEANSSEETSSEDASAEDASSEETGVEGGGASSGDEATGEDAVCHADDGTSAEADHTTDANPPADTRRGGDQEETKGIEAIVTKLPRMAPIRTPWVGSPPPQAIQRRNEIIKRTGSPPELHHAQVRQAAEHVAQAARDAQRRMVWQVGNLARDTRISIEDMAKEILKVTAAAVAHINAAIETAIGDVGMVAEDEVAHIDAQGLVTAAQLEANRSATNIQIMNDLKQGSSDIQALNAVSEEHFNNYQIDAEAKVANIPDTGVVGRLPPPPAPPAPPSTRHFPVPPADPIPQEGDRTADYQLISHAHEALTSFVDTKSLEVAASNGGNNPRCANYYSLRSTTVLDPMIAQKYTQMIQNAQQASEQMTNANARAQFHMMLLGLTTPISDYHARDGSAVADANERAIRATMTETQYAAHQAIMTIYEKRDQAAEYLDRDLREDLTDNLNKMGRKAYKGLMEQASSAEVTLESSAAPMAEGYRELVDRLNVLLPAGQFLDAHTLVPKLIGARDNAESMRAQHVEMAEQQSLSTLEQMQKAKKDQAEGITKAGNESANSVHNIVIQTGFDMALFGQQMTGTMSARGIAGMSAAQGFAAHNAKAIMDSIHGTRGTGLTSIDRAVVGFFNGRIAGAEQGQFAGLAAFVEQMENATSGPLVPPMTEANKNLNDRSTALDNAMPERDMSTVAELGAGSLLCPLGGAIALGVYLYHTDASESNVMIQLGNLLWPGILGLEEVFRAQGHHGLQDRIRDRLNDTEKNQALLLFNESAAIRGAARLEIARGSTAWFTGVNREARESVLQGMSGEERGLNAGSVASTRTFLEGELSGTQEELSLAYLDGNRDAAAAARTHEAMENARKEGEWGWIFSADDARERSDSARVEAMGRMDEVIRSELAVETAYLDPSVINAHHDGFYRSFATYVDPNHRSFGSEASREVVRSYATSSYNSAVIGFNPLGLLIPPMGIATHVERVATGADARDYINNVIDHGASSDQAHDARGVFEMNRAERETTGILGTLGLSGISNTTQTRLSDAFEDRGLADLERRLAAATTVEDRSRLTREVEEARTHHRERLQVMAVRLGAPANISPADAEAFMSQRMGTVFATTDTFSQAVGISESGSHARYGTEMIEHGRASLDAGVALASDGLGTNDDMLKRSYADRTHAEIATANTRWASEHSGEDMTEMLGIHTASATTPVGAGSWFSTFGAETSGDLAQELQVLALGNPETDADRVTVASLRYRQQHDAGTGFITDQSMRGTDEERFMDESHTRMARTILTAAAQRDPTLLARFGDNPNAIFNADGSLNSAVNAAAFDGQGHFRGNSSALQFAGDNMGYAADAFRAEVDRQEAMVMSAITTLALIVSLVLLVVPGVDIVAAGIITAILTGAATIVAKAGMRGGRYGWEEAATDVAQAAVEAAAAGVGGAISRGMEEGVTAATKLGRLASFGRTLSTRFGKFGGAIIREAIVGAASTAAQTAMQDDIWNDGLGRGLQRVANGAIRGAAVSAATTFASEAITHSLTKPRFDANGLERANPAALMEKRMGAHAAEVMREGITNTAGALVGEAVGVGIDYAQGNFHGTFGEALRQIGTAGLRELITSSIRGHIMRSNRMHFEHLMDAAQRGGTLSDSELHALRAYGISAGVFHHGDDIAHVRGAVLEGRTQLNSPLLAQLPPNLREHLTTLDHESLGRLVSLLEQGGNPLSHPENLAFIHGLTVQIPGVSGETLAHEFGAVAASRRAGAVSELDTAQRGQLREHLGAGLHDELRAALGDIAVDGMQHLSPEHLAQAAEMIANGKFNFDTADNLLRAAKAKNPDLDEFAFLHNLHAAVATSERVQDHMYHTALERHRALVAMVPEEAAKIFATLGNMEVLTAQRLINSGSGGTPQERDALFHAALAKNPKLSREQFHGFMEAAAGRVRERIDTERQARRNAREERMTHLPEELRSTLSALPEAALVELRLRQMQGSLSPDDAVRLLNMAQRETPNVNLHELEAALHEAVKHAPTHSMSDAQTAEARQHLLSAIPADQRGQIEHTPILVLPADEFNALTRSQKGQAVTLIINGEPVVVLREGANPRALREEGIHALQARDKNWAAHIGSLDEHTMAQWDSLPLEQQIALYRNKLALEIDAQTQLIHSLEADIGNASGHEKLALQQHLEQVQRAHENLSRRQSEVGGLSDLDIHNMRAGFSERPQWLEQPARLFSKEDDSTRPVRSAEEAAEAAKLHKEILRSFEGDRRRNLANVLEKMPIETLRALHAMPNELKNDSVLFNRMVIAGGQAADPIAFGAGLHAVTGAFSGKDLPALAQHLQRLTTGDLGNAMISISHLAGSVTDTEAFRTLVSSNLQTASQGVERLGILAHFSDKGVGADALLGLNQSMHSPGGLDNARALGLPTLGRMLEITSSPSALHKLGELLTRSNPTLLLDSVEHITKALGHAAVHDLIRLIGRGNSSDIIVSLGKLARLAPDDPNLPALLAHGDSISTSTKVSMAGGSSTRLFGNNLKELVDARINLVERVQDLQRHAQEAKDLANMAGADIAPARKAAAEAHEIAQAYQQEAQNFGEVAAREFALEHQLRSGDLHSEADAAKARALQAVEDGQRAHQEAKNALRETERLTTEAQRREQEHQELVARADEKVAIADEAQKSLDRHRAAVTAIDNAQRKIDMLKQSRAPSIKVMPESEFIKRRNAEISAAEETIKENINILNHEVSAAQGLTERRRKSLRGGTPTNETRNNILTSPPNEDRTASGKPKDWVTGEELAADSSVTAIDHIYPVAEIFNEPGFSELPINDQIEILNMRDNLAPLEVGRNGSKNDSDIASWLDSTAPLKPTLTPQQRINAIARETRARDAVRAEIRKRVQAWRSR